MAEPSNLMDFFQVPATPDQAAIPFARVNHNKYMVTESVGYVGTSNWSADYFLNTGGIGLVFSSANTSSSDLRQQLRSIFSRDWNSAYAYHITVDKNGDPLKGMAPAYVPYERHFQP